MNQQPASNMLAPSDDIVLVDDDPMVSEFMRRVLRGSGRRVRDFTNPVEALTYLSSHEPAILIVDNFMPMLCGTELLGELQQLKRLTNTRMILCTAARRLPDANALLGLETVELVPKDELLDRRTLLQRLGGPVHRFAGAA